jgi:PAS domain S-box-containing protein
MRRYALVVLGVSLATGLRLLLNPLLGDAFPFITFFFAILVAARLGGFGPALVATFVSELAAVLFILPPVGSWTVHGYQNQTGVVLFFAVGLAVAILGGGMRDALWRVKALAAETSFQHEELRTTLKSIGDAVIVTDAEGRVRTLNPVAEALTGWTTDAAINQPLDRVFVIVNERTRQPVANPVELVLSQGTVVGLANHTVLIAKDATERPIDDSAAPIRDGGGELVGVVLVFRDVTERRRAEESQRRLAAIVSSSDDAIIGKTLDGTITSWNAGAERIYGYPAAEVLGKPFSILVPPDHVAEVQDGARRLSRGERLDHYETVRRRKDGTLIDVSVSYSPIKDDDGHLIGTAVTTRNITEQKRAELALRESEAKFRLMADTIPQLAWMARPDGHIFWFNRLWHEYTGTTPEQMEGWGWQSALNPEMRLTVLERWRHSIAHGEPLDMVFSLRGADGVYRPFLTRVNPLRADGGRIVNWFGTNTDISEQQRAEADSRFLADASASLAGLTNYESTLQKVAGLAVPTFADWAAVDVLDEAGKLRRVAVAHIDPAKIELAHELHRRFPPDPDAPQGIWCILRTGKSEIVTEIPDEMLVESVKDPELLRIVRELGVKSYMGVPLSVRGKVLGVITFIAAESGRRYSNADLAVAEDLAHRVAVAIENARLYDEVRQADRRKEDFLSLLAHELRNPLAPIRNGLEIVKLSGVSTPPIEMAIGMMERQVQHLVRLVDDLLDVSRLMRDKIELRRAPVDLAMVVARAIETSRPVIDAERHELIVQLPHDPLWVDGDTVRLAQAISNLLNNAARYTPPEGRIHLTVQPQGNSAIVCVRDTGIGVVREMLPRIFDMFVQAERITKVAQGGMGIGLTLVRRIIEMHGGTVAAQSDGPGTGSEFKIELPMLVRNAPPETKDRGANSAPGPAPQKIMVVDDNVDAAESLALLLQLGGNDTTVAHDGATALTLAASQPPDIAFLDIGMPQMDGYELARRFRAHPQLKEVTLIAVTGWGQDEDRRRTKEAGFDAHQVKPVEPDAIRQLLTDPKLKRLRV